jgi:hypothetical protein
VTKKAILIAPLAALAMAGCIDVGEDGANGADGVNGVNDANGLNSLVAFATLPPGNQDCAGGGRIVTSGLDTNGNGTLDASEVTSREFLECLTAPQLRALHASPDAPPVNIRVNGAQALAGVDYAAGSGFLPVPQRTRVQVEAIIPGGNAIVIDESLDLEFSTEYTVIAAGTVAAPVAALVVSNPDGQAIAPGSLRLQVVHAAPAAPDVDVYVTAPDASIASGTPVNGSPLGFRENTGRVQVAAGSYRIRVTAAGDASAVVYDSGTVALAAGADLMVVAVENTHPDGPPIQLVALDGTGAATIRDAGTPGSVVAVHASPDAPAVDILADITGTATIESLGLARTLAFPQACRIPAVPAGAYALSVTAAGNPQIVALQFPLTVEPSAELAAIVTGYLGSTPAIQPLALAGNLRSITTESKLRITHASPGTPAVDVYLLADDTVLTSSSVIPSFAAVGFGANTGVISVAPGVYDVYVTPAGNKNVVAIAVDDFAVSGGDVLDIIARDAATNGSEGTLPRLVVVDHASVASCPN